MTSRPQPLVLLLTVVSAVALTRPIRAEILDDCSGLEDWSAHPAEGVSLELSIDDSALRLDFSIPAAGYAVARKEVRRVLPENYAFRLRLRGAAQPNHLEFKLIDSTGESVWWSVRRDFTFPTEWRRLSVRKRHLEFAWGPAGGGEIREISAIELAITAGEGGTGSVWIDDLELVRLAPEDSGPFEPTPSASSSRPANGAILAADGDPHSAWIPDPEDPEASIALDLGTMREYSGLIVDWQEGRFARDYVLEASDDGDEWTHLRSVVGANGGRDPHYLGEVESRFLRLRLLESTSEKTIAVSELELQPIDWAGSRLEFFRQLARSAPRGVYPRGMRDEQVYWTVVGTDFDAREALLSEDGALEVGSGRHCIEPFVLVGGKLFGWADAEIEQSLLDGYLPIPTVRWRLPQLELVVTAFATGSPGASSIVLRYEVASRSSDTVAVTLALALRPFQVNPPSQTLNLQGGIAPIHTIEHVDDVVRIDGKPSVVSLSRSAAFGAATFDGGDIVADHLRYGSLPQNASANDAFNAASAALTYELVLEPGGSRTIDILVPLYPERPLPDVDDDTWVERELERSRAAWQGRLDRLQIEIPAAADAVRTLRSQIAYLLVNRAGPALQPGTRSYARSWIRDGALSSWALLRCGEVAPARDFLRWYAPHQFESGKIPCVVDHRGADPVPEHDSNGEFIFLVAEIYRHTGDRDLLATVWPRIRDALDYLDELRRERLTAEFEAPAKRHFYGILPPSISHEGYSAKPMHSYWDDFFALRGFRDGAFLARELGRLDEAKAITNVAQDFSSDLGASVAAAMEKHGIDYVPGCADLGDFDPTSTTVALAPAEAASILPEGALERTFDRYLRFFRNRRDDGAWTEFTPYEVRTIGSFVRLGWRERAGELLDWFLEQRRPAGWNQWPEVVRAEHRQPGFLGDLPHSWVGSDYVRSFLDMLVYHRAKDDALVLAAGVQSAWLDGSGLTVTELPLPTGSIGYRLHRRGDELLAEIDGALGMPPGGLILRAPGMERAEVAVVNGVTVPLTSPGEFRVPRLPARLSIVLPDSPH